MTAARARTATIAGTEYEIRLDGRSWDPWDMVRQVRRPPEGAELDENEYGGGEAVKLLRAPYGMGGGPDARR